jgi:ATP-dependent RNA helicase DeaD
MESFRIEVGHTHGVQPGNIVGAIANEAGLEGKHIGHIDIREDHSFVDLPAGMPKEIFRELKKVRVRGTELRISRVDSKPPRQERTPRAPDAPSAQPAARRGNPHRNHRGSGGPKGATHRPRPGRT